MPFSRMCNFGAQAERRNERRDVTSYLDVDISNDQHRLVNPTPLECIAGYVMESSIGDTALERLPHRSLPQKRLKIIDRYISSY